MLFRNVPRLEQPQGPVDLDRSHPLVRGLVSVISAGDLKPPLVRVGTPFARPSVAGAALYGGTSSIWTQSGLTFGSEATIAAFCNLPINNTGQFPFGLGNSGAGNQNFLIQSAGNSTQPRALIRTVNGGGVSTVEFAGSTTLSSYPDPAFYLAVYDGTANLTVYKNGYDISGTRNNSAASGSIATIDNSSLGGINRGTDLFHAGTDQFTSLVLAWNRALSASEVALLGGNPWQIFEPRRIWVPVSAGGGANNTLTGDSGSYTYTGNAAAFQVTRALDGAVGSYTLTGNTGTFSYIPGAGSIPYTLSGATGAYAYTGNAATFRVGHSLSGATGAYAYSGNAATFKVGHALPGAAGAYAFTGRDGTFAYVGSTAYALSGDSGSYSLTGTEGAFAFSGAAKPAGGYDEARKKKRFVVKVGDKLVEYGSASAAAKALNKAPEAKPEPVAEVPIRKIKAQARVFKAEQQVQNLFKQQDFEAMLALYEQMQDEDDIETLLMLV